MTTAEYGHSDTLTRVVSCTKTRLSGRLSVLGYSTYAASFTACGELHASRGPSWKHVCLSKTAHLSMFTLCVYAPFSQ